MRIALVSAYDIGVPSGVNAHILHLAREIRSRGHEVRCFFPGHPGTEVPEGCAVIGRPYPVRSGDSVARIALSPFLGRQVARALNQGRFDVVHVHEPLTPALPMHFVWQSRTLTVGTFHACHDGGDIRYWLARPLLSRFAARLHGRAAVSPAAARFVLRYFPGDFEIIPNGIDVARFSNPAPRPDAVGGLGPYILFVGRFEERKGLPVLLEAYARLKPRVPEAELVVVGSGERRKHYGAWLARRGLGGVHFVGRVSDEDLAGYYQHSAVFCAPNTGNESFGIVLLEAMAAGCPVVASNIEGFAELAAYGAHALLVTPRSPDALADALTRVLTNPSLRAALATRGNDRAREFDWPVVTDAVLDFYRKAGERSGFAIQD